MPAAGRLSDRIKPTPHFFRAPLPLPGPGRGVRVGEVVGAEVVGVEVGVEVVGVAVGVRDGAGVVLAIVMAALRPLPLPTTCHPSRRLEPEPDPEDPEDPVRRLRSAIAIASPGSGWGFGGGAFWLSTVWSSRQR